MVATNVFAKQGIGQVLQTILVVSPSKAISADKSFEPKKSGSFYHFEEQQECLDVDECEGGTHHCSLDGACQNTDGSYKCACNAGRTFTANIFFLLFIFIYFSQNSILADTVMAQ